jgi:hypothetical protein
MSLHLSAQEPDFWMRIVWKPDITPTSAVPIYLKTWNTAWQTRITHNIIYLGALAPFLRRTSDINHAKVRFLSFATFPIFATVLYISRAWAVKGTQRLHVRKPHSPRVASGSGCPTLVDGWGLYLSFSAYELMRHKTHVAGHYLPQIGGDIPRTPPVKWGFKCPSSEKRADLPWRDRATLIDYNSITPICESISTHCTYSLICFPIGEQDMRARVRGPDQLLRTYPWRFRHEKSRNRFDLKKNSHSTSGIR